RPGIEPTALVDRVDEGSQSHGGKTPRPAGGDVAQQVADDALGEVVGFDLLGDREPADPRGEPPVTADDPREESLMPQVIEPPIAAVALPRGVQEGEPAGTARSEEPGLDRLGER